MDPLGESVSKLLPRPSNRTPPRSRPRRGFAYQSDKLSAYAAGNKCRYERVCSLTALTSAGFPMSITAHLLDDFDVDPETKRVLGVALEKTRASLGLADDFANGIIAKRLIELAKAGEHNP